MTVDSGLLIFGAGGFAREVSWLAEVCHGAGVGPSPVGFVDDDPARQGRSLHGRPVMGPDEARDRFPDAAYVIAAGKPATRRAVAARLDAVGVRWATLVHPGVERSSRGEIGTGSVVCAGSVLTTEIVLGEHVHVNLHCTIGHDAILGDFVTLAPGVHVSGCVRLGDGVYVGSGAVIVNGTPDAPLAIDDGAVIGAAACATRPVEQGVTVVGIPARPLRRD